MAKLKIIWADNREQEFEITKPVITIGRTSDNDVKLPESGISRQQCKIEGSPGNYSVVDLDSKNGTMVNGTRISTSQLKDSDTIVIGRITIVFKEDSEDETREEALPVGHVCPSCGGPIKDGDVLCVKCGTFIKKEGAGTEGGMKIKDNWIAWVLLLVVIGILAVGGIMLTRNGEEETVEDQSGLTENILKIIRKVETPTVGTYGDLFDNLNISNSELDVEPTEIGKDTGTYRVILNFKTAKGIQNMEFTVDIQSALGKAEMDDEEFTFTDF
jgi:pSer/pThr/pTyr-binding forkhead associated (FHA) protein